MTHQEAGTMGGIATGQKWGLAICPHCGSQYVRGNWYKGNGKKGGLSTMEKHGTDQYRRMGKLGGRGNKKERKGAEPGLAIALQGSPANCPVEQI